MNRPKIAFFRRFARVRKYLTFTCPKVKIYQYIPIQMSTNSNSTVVIGLSTKSIISYLYGIWTWSAQIISGSESKLGIVDIQADQHWAGLHNTRWSKSHLEGYLVALTLPLCGKLGLTLLVKEGWVLMGDPQFCWYAQHGDRVGALWVG